MPNMILFCYCIDINQSILELVKNKDNFDNAFDTSVKKKQATVSKNHTFDSRQTVITVGPNNTRFPFDTEEFIFMLSDMNPACLKAQQGEKMKPIKPEQVEQEKCVVCLKAKADFKGKKIV